jgi:tol-pal system protein YbgF
MKNIRRAGSLALILLGGCLASKGDIRLLQDEIRATRAQIAVADTSRMRSDDARRAQIASLASSVERISDSLRSLNGRFSAFQANTAGQFDAVGQQIVQIQSLLGQTTRGMAEARAQLEALREQGLSSGSSSPAPTGADTSKGAPAGPGPATIFTTSVTELRSGSYRTALNGFDELIRTYPDYSQVPRAQVYVGDAYKALGNLPAADSVYQLVPTRYPKSPDAATGLYKHAMILWDANKRAEARIFFNQVIRDYPNSPEAALASDRLRPKE